MVSRSTDYLSEKTFRTTRPMSRPAPAPTTTSLAWWMRTWILEAATTPASPYQSGFTLERSDNRVAAMNAAEACPDGKLLVSGCLRLCGLSSS